MSDQNINCCMDICDKIKETTKLSKEISETAKALKLSKDALSIKEKELLNFSDICANGNTVYATDNVSDSIISNGIQSSVNDVVKNGSELAVGAASKLSNGMSNFAFASKSKISTEMDQMLSSFSSTMSCHTVNGVLVGLVTGYLAAYVYSQKRKKYHD